MIKVVLIDVDNTLLDFDACARQSVKAAWDALGLDWTPSVFPVFKSVNDGLWRDIERKTLTRERLHFLRFRLVFERLGINADADAAEEIFVRELTVSDVKVEGAERLLAHLSSKYTVCVASNAPNARQMGRLTTAGLFGYIDRMFVSADIGHDKPSKEFFDACFAALAPVRPDETVIIGDSLSADIAGGRAYGLHTCWFNYDGLPARGDEAEWIVRSLDEIRTFL